MTAYYNEFDPKAAAWLRELIKRGLIADGIVDERSIIDVEANDLVGFAQCHFFAGIGGWSHALRLAGIPDDYPIWTASLPCQPFSAAGKQLGKADARHLLPHYIKLVKQCRPAIQFGEQVASAIRHGWACDLQAAMEAEDYAVGYHVLGAHSAGAYHQRQRLYWVAYSGGEGSQGRAFLPECADQRAAWSRGMDGGMGNTGCEGLFPSAHGTIHSREEGSGSRHVKSERSSLSGGMVNAKSDRFGAHGYRNSGEIQRENWQEKPEVGFVVSSEWASPDWINCRDNKLRPIKPGIEPLVNGVPARVVRLRGYGNAIVPQVAAAFIEAFFDVESGKV